MTKVAAKREMRNIQAELDWLLQEHLVEEGVRLARGVRDDQSGLTVPRLLPGDPSGVQFVHHAVGDLGVQVNMGSSPFRNRWQAPKSAYRGLPPSVTECQLSAHQVCSAKLNQLDGSRS